MIQLKEKKNTSLKFGKISFFLQGKISYLL